MKAIVTCACAGAPRYCQSSYKVLFPNEELPTMYIKEKAKAILESVPEDSKMYQELAKILRKRGRYGFYFEYNDQGEILDYWNLLKHRRVA